MNTARQLGFPALLDSRHLPGSTQKKQNDQQSTEPPSLKNKGESGTCKACNNAGYIRLDEHHFEACPFC